MATFQYWNWEEVDINWGLLDLNWEEVSKNWSFKLPDSLQIDCEFPTLVLEIQ